MTARTCTLVLAFAFAIPAAYAADPAYKSTMPDGRVIYSENPQPGAKRVDKLAAPPENAGIVVVDEAAKARAALIPPPAGAGVTVIPEKKRESPAYGQQGYEPNPGRQLPSRGY